MNNDPQANAEANRLYWESDEPVAEIAARLDLSRRALYDAVQPLPTGGQCASCGGDLGYPNRSARTAGMAVCGSCGEEAIGGAAEASGDESHADSDDQPWTWSPDTSEPGPGGTLDRRVLWMGAAALAGALAAAALTYTLLPVQRD